MHPDAERVAQGFFHKPIALGATAPNPAIVYRERVAQGFFHKPFALGATAPNPAIVCRESR